MKKESQIGREVKTVTRYSEALKLEVVRELDAGGVTVREAMDFYDIPWSRTINRWRQKYGQDRRRTRIVRVMMKSEQDRIRELEKALADKELELLAMRALASVYEEDYGKELKKKLSPEQLAELESLRRRAKLP